MAGGPLPLFALVGALLVGGALSQGLVPENYGELVNFNLFIEQLSFASVSPMLQDSGSDLAREIREGIRTVFQPMGGDLQEVTFADGDTCVKAVVTWVNSDASRLMEIVDDVRNSGIVARGQTWDVNFNGCAAETSLLTFKLYVRNMMYRDTMADKTSTDYMQIEEDLDTALGDLGGQLRALDISENFGCVELYIDWDARRSENIIDITTRLKTSGMVIMGRNYEVQTRPCTPNTVSVDECPPPGIGICVEGCNDEDPAMRCQSGLKCCSNGCGHVCMRVGYKAKVSAVIHTDVPWMDGMDMTTGPVFENMRDVMVSHIYSAFNQDQETLQDVDLTGVSASVRRMSSYVTASVDLYLKMDFENLVLQKGAMELETKSLELTGDQIYNVIHVELLSTGGAADSCDGVQCHGVCKQLFSGDFYCSCDEGRIGPGCMAFDCRLDLTQFPIPTDSSEHCQNGGKCRYDTDEEGYRCECPNGYFGETCQVRLCDMFVAPKCQYHSACEVDLGRGQLCKCSYGYKGLFCQEEGQEDLTRCEAERRLNTFVHEQVTGMQPRSPILSTTMQVILQRMGSPVYSVPHCWENSSPMARDYHSVCHHDIFYGRIQGCECLNSDGEENGYSYFGPGDCRVFSGPMNEGSFEVYLPDVDWTLEMADRESMVYLEIRGQIYEFLMSNGIMLSQIAIVTTDDCTTLRIHWQSDEMPQRTMVNQLVSSGVLVHGVHTRVSQKPCNSYDIHQCPRFDQMQVAGMNHNRNMNNGGGPGGIMIGAPSSPVTSPQTCASPSCESDSDCGGENHKCCSSICGSAQCMEVGFLERAAVNLTLEIPWDPALADVTSDTYMSFKTSVEEAADTALQSLRVNGYSSVEVVGFGEASVSVSAVTRRKRQTRYTVVMIHIKFNEEINADVLQRMRTNLLRDGLEINGDVYSFSSITFQNSDKCGDYSCEGDAICVIRVGETKYCACSFDKTGFNCSRSNCFRDGIDICDHGTCMYRIEDNSRACECDDGYFGETCTDQICDLVKGDACNTGRCVGDVSSGRMCSCLSGSGGLFCQDPTPDGKMTECQMEHRMMDYVRSVIQNEVSDDKLDISMKDFMKRLNQGPSFMVPSCRPNRGDFEFYCMYNIETGAEEGCYCVDVFGNRNFMYFDQMYRRCMVNVMDCMSTGCRNGGSCSRGDDGGSYCECPQPFSGAMCELSDENRCALGPPLTMDSGDEMQCRMQPCPFGFSCNGEAADRWTACCFKQDFLCDLNPCQNGRCVGDFSQLQVCECRPGFSGLFCEREEFETDTPCQRANTFYQWMRDLLSNNTEFQVTSAQLRRVLGHLEIDWIPINICDNYGAFMQRANAFNVFNLNSDMMEVCLSAEGYLDPTCSNLVCSTLSTAGISLCRNGGRCVGDLRHQLCDCSNTDFGGILCGDREVSIKTECQVRAEIADYGIGILNGSNSEDGISNALMRQLLTQALSWMNADDIFRPVCDEKGMFTNIGCVHPADNPNRYLCYCSDMDGENMKDDTIAVMGLPDRSTCMGDGDHGEVDCPRPEWGPSCVRPAWWCSDEVQCNRHTERCVRTASCLECPVEHQCVPRLATLPCSQMPCADNPSEMCTPCGRHGTCISLDTPDLETGVKYRCQCSVGFHGSHCEIQNNVCDIVPQSVCEDGCVGNIDAGHLCRCPRGYSGLDCMKMARTECEIRKAMYDDAIAVLKGVNTFGGLSIQDAKDLVRLVTRTNGGEEIPTLTCNEDGSYGKTACSVNIDTLEEYCYCLDDAGDFKSSNIEPHIDFEQCAGPIDTRDVAGYLCSSDSGFDFCLNGGKCTLNIYEGEGCSCPQGNHGTFCQYEGVAAEKPMSFCTYMRDAYHTVRSMLRGEMPSSSEDQMMAWRAMTYDFLWAHNVSDTKRVIWKPECDPDGHFTYKACFYHPETDMLHQCYCTNAVGPNLLFPIAEDSTGLECVAAQHVFRQCGTLDCPRDCHYGYKMKDGCPTCQCQSACENTKCPWGQRCAIQMDLCDSNSGNMYTGRRGELCEHAVCRPILKPGMCPFPTVNTYGSIIGGGLRASGNDGNCDVHCLDDSYCPGDSKCCSGPNLCGSSCIEPLATTTCQDWVELSKQEVIFRTSVQESLNSRVSLSNGIIRELTRINSQHLWRPTCATEDDDLFQGLCAYRLDALRYNQNPDLCVCSDRRGHPTDMWAQINIFTMCSTKPGSCPFIDPYYVRNRQPGQDENPDYHLVMTLGLKERVPCSEDLDCMGSAKCCGMGDLDNSISSYCAKPLMGEDKPEMNHMDMLMENLCTFNPAACEEGTCDGKWSEDGQACSCPQTRRGPFCELSADQNNRPNTPCEHKELAYERLHSYVQASDEKLRNLTVQYAAWRKIPYSFKDITYTMTQYSCYPDGSYEPLRCEEETHSSTSVRCYCVEEDGKEIDGTRTEKISSIFCGQTSHSDHEGQCPRGSPISNATGELLECGVNTMSCPRGYACKRSTYGKMYCCPREALYRDSCELPLDRGHRTCMEDQETRYYFNRESRQCTSFTYLGCGGNDNSFSTMAECNSICLDNEHPGSCPASPFMVPNTRDCEDECSEDDDCMAAEKCCMSSCGHRCFPAIVERPLTSCPYGERHNETLCSQGCPTGYKCFGSECCPDVENHNICMFPPPQRVDPRACTARIPRYFYNAETKMCEMFHYTGCENVLNNFPTVEECCKACGTEARCKAGTCPAIRPGSSTSCSDTCSSDSQCRGTRICCSNGCAKHCVLPHVERPSDCLERQLLARRSSNAVAGSMMCNNVDEPECTKDGHYRSRQCNVVIGVCWCVTPMGYYVNHTMMRGFPDCDAIPEHRITAANEAKVNSASVNMDVCPQGESVHCCRDNVCNRPCTAYPKARCRINPCGSAMCQAEYYDEDGNIVNCTRGLPACTRRRNSVLNIMQEMREAARRMMATNEDDDDDRYEDMEDRVREHLEQVRERAENMAESAPSKFYSGIPLQCQYKPDPSMCEGFAPMWYFDPDSGVCKMFVWGMCEGNANRFSTPEECYRSCKAEASPCHVSNCTSVQKCRLTFNDRCYLDDVPCQLSASCVAMESELHVTGLYMPKCTASGEFNYKQCYGDYCWCVDAEGDINSQIMRSSIECGMNGLLTTGAEHRLTCPDGQSAPRTDCINACEMAKCHGNPRAHCRVDLCSCQTDFVDDMGQTVQCEDDPCDVENEDEMPMHCKRAQPLCNGASIKTCPANVCEAANGRGSCSKNPCALCMVDPCTCSPYYINAISRARITNQECALLSLGNCEVVTCGIMTEIEEARFAGEEVAALDRFLPQCDADGKFKTRQCRGGNCTCVDEFGFPTEADPTGNCNEFDPLRRVRASLSYPLDFDQLERENKLEPLREQLIERLVASGIDRRNLKVGKAYKGSVKFDVEITQDPNAVTQDMAVVNTALQQSMRNGDLDVTVDGQTVALDSDSSAVTAQTASQVAEEERRDEVDDDDDGLSDTEIIIIAVVCSVVGLLILTILVYCCCCRRKTKNTQTPVDDSTYDHVRIAKSNTYDNPSPAVYNKAYEEEGHYTKVRL